jgi:hypothetical protein
MSDRTIAFWTIAAFAWVASCEAPSPGVQRATPVAAQAPAPTTTAFDGTYVGVSRTLEGQMAGDPGSTRACAKNAQPPRPLTIARGVVRWPASEAEGSVNAQGVLVMHGPTDLMHGPSEWRFDGQIDGRGMVTGRLTSFCSYHFVWQKEGT